MPRNPVRLAFGFRTCGRVQDTWRATRCPHVGARTGDLLLVRREHLLPSTAACRSGRSASDEPSLAAALCCGLPLPKRFHLTTQAAARTVRSPAGCLVDPIMGAVAAALSALPDVSRLREALEAVRLLPARLSAVLYSVRYGLAAVRLGQTRWRVEQGCTSRHWRSFGSLDD